MELPKHYQASDYEKALYQQWLKNTLFEASPDSPKEPFTIILPPPNATGTLHLGHAVMIALEDIMIRFKRMQGYEALWVPGTDHAGIATQSRVEKNLQEAGIENPRSTLGREKLIQEIKDFVAQSQDTIRTQMQSMGASCDWSKEAYTFDPKINEGVNEVFKRMFEDGVMYQGNRIVNWDPHMQTTVADDEVEYIQETSKFYYLQYGPIVIGTARPETKFLDKIIVVHPDDERYKQYIGKSIELEWIDGPITATVIADECADMEMGTGAMTITPAHSLVDFELAQKYNLDIQQIIDFEGKIRTDISEEFGGMDIFEARGKIVEKLDKKGLVVEIDEKYVHKKAVNYRGGGIIEPQVMKQWFIDVNKKVIDWKGKQSSMKEVMIDVVKSEMIEIIPSRFEKIYFNWIDNLQDWCVSRQIWWGHQIPMWYQLSTEDTAKVEKNGGVSSSYELQSLNIEPLVFVCSNEKPKEEGYWIQDPDCLDTWFSSGAWTFTSLGWPHRDDLLKKFHPTSVLETGYDIIFFWVARMILMSTYIMRGEGYSEDMSLPFKKIYLHGLVLDRDGRKMSKSRPETCIDPLDMIEKYGADALRLSLIIGATPGNNVRLYEEKIAGYSNFITKVWNIGRFVLQQIEHQTTDIDIDTLTRADQWILNMTQDVIGRATEGLESYRFSEVGEMVYQFLKDDFASWYLEIAKIEGDKGSILRYIFQTVLKLLHPYIPYVTEILWQSMNASDESLALAPWPVQEEKYTFGQAEHFQSVISLITSIRRERAESHIDVKTIIPVFLDTSDEYILQYADLIAQFTDIQYSEKTQRMLPVPSRGVVVWMDFGDVDKEKEIFRLQKEIERCHGQLRGIQAKLQNEKFLLNADAEIVQTEKEKEINFQHRITSFQERITLISAS